MRHSSQVWISSAWRQDARCYSGAAAPVRRASSGHRERTRRGLRSESAQGLVALMIHPSRLPASELPTPQPIGDWTAAAATCHNAVMTGCQGAPSRRAGQVGRGEGDRGYADGSTLPSPDVQEIGFDAVAPIPFHPASCGQDSPLYVGGTLSIPPKRRLMGQAALGAATRHLALRQ